MKNSAARSQAGVALLVAIFALLLISGVAVALVVMSGTETSVAANYRSTTQAFYAGYAGLEEVRGRLWPGHPSSLFSIANFLPAVGTTLPVGQVRYILNPSPGEVVSPTNLVATNAYADNEYQVEFGAAVTGATVLTTASISNLALANTPGPLFKWVRITAKTERSSGIDINGDGVLDNAIPIFYDGTNQNLTSTGRQVFRATTLAVMPNGSRRILQYDLSAVVLNLQFASALTFDGNGSALFPANSNVYTVNGNDAASCGTPPDPARPALGVLSPGDDAAITAAIPPNRLSKYTGSGPAPDVQNVSGSLSPNMQTVSSLEALVATITANADQVVQGPAASLPNYGTANAPTITVVNGDLNLQGQITGYGILVVTGNFSAGGSVGWRGIVLVIGQGTMSVSGGGNNSYEGAVLLARTHNDDPTGAGGGSLLPGPAPGPTLLDWAGGGGNGVHYDSCTIRNATNNVVYRVLSFREVSE
ncbi:MAG: pilus assembly PilX N-terminal domain-containing protein [Acidobacteria bacterium]|nr:pilus assembly PilX N-terminal domain-containing protein [Acidobacteriota bacterium]MCL5288686.1 pilus assembly PilX N-terminal domain-containing protein [Acidobacteriota bacterium]